MKSISQSIVIAALVSLICIFAASNASAQIKLPITCCYNSPSTPDLLADVGTQGAFVLSESHGFIWDSMFPTNSINSKMFSTLNVFESSAIVQFSSSAARPIADKRDAHTFLVNDRKIHLG